MVDNTDIASNADDKTHYSVLKSQCDKETKLQKTSVTRFKWFHENALKSNQHKFHFLSSLDYQVKSFAKTSWCNNCQKVEF